MEAKAIAKFQRVSPRKTRLVARNVVGLGVEDAMNLLRFTPNKPAGILYGVVKSALANASDTSLNVDAMFVKEVLVNEGPTWKRFMPRAQGRATRVRKRTSHITVILAEEQEYWVRKYIRMASGWDTTRTGSAAGSPPRNILPSFLKTAKSAAM